MLFIEDKEIIELENKYSELKKELDEIKFPGTYALRHNIYGVDLDPKAIDITAFTLMVQVYDELKEGARCPTMIGENLKVGNSLVSVITSEKREGFISREELTKFKKEISELTSLREIEKNIDVLDEDGLKKLIKENFGEVIDIYRRIKEKYPNAIPTPQQKLLDEWHKRAKKEPIEKTFDVLINQTGLARIFLKEVYFEKIERIKEKIEFEMNKPLINYFNSKKRVLKDKELKEILADEGRIKEELRFVKDRAAEISKSQPPKVFNWEIEFPEVFFDEDELKENLGFDCVVGNPPYVSFGLRGAERMPEGYFQFYNEMFPYSAEYKISLYAMFMNEGIKLLNSKGKHSFIVPDSFLLGRYFSKIRRYILDNCQINTLLYIESKVFLEGTVGISVIYTLTREPLKEVRVNTNMSILKAVDIKNFAEKNFIKTSYPQNYFEQTKYNRFRLFFDEFSFKLVQTIESKGEHLLKYLGGHTGVRSLSAQSNIVSKKKLGITWRKGLISGAQIERYHVKYEGHFININPKLICKGGWDKNVVENPKILIRQTSDSIIAALDINKYYHLNSLHSFSPISQDLDLKFLLSLLNSSLLNHYYHLITLELGRTMAQTDIETLEQLPIYPATPDQQSPIISLVETIIQKKKEYHAISQNIEDYIDFKKTKLVRLEDFLKNAMKDFEVLSSLKVKTDNFDVLRVRIERDDVFLEYGIRRKVEERKYEIEWHLAGEGKIKDLPAPRPNKYHVYVLKCSDGSLYKGYTSNLEKRIDEHKSGLVKWTSKRLPLELIYYEEYGSEKEAIKREKELKMGFGRGWLKKVVASRQAGKVAIEFLSKILEKEKRISKAKTKTIWQKIAEVKALEFSEEVRQGFLKFKSAMEKAKELDDAITKMDRAIDRLVYDLYGLTDDEVMVVEKSVWGEKFEEMYSKLPSKEDALKLAKEVQK